MARNAKPAAVMGSLVNLKNVATHKSIALTIHVPAEAAQAVLGAFGWPTMVDPVSVAVARLEESASLTQPVPEYDNEAMQRELARGMQNTLASPAAREEPSPKDVLGVVKETSDAPIRKLAASIADRAEKLNKRPVEPTRSRHWAEMTPSQQTGVIRNEREFWEFAKVSNAEEARDIIRAACFVESCADIRPGTVAAAAWTQLQVRYGNWLRRRRGAA